MCRLMLPHLTALFARVQPLHTNPGLEAACISVLQLLENIGQQAAAVLGKQHLENRQLFDSILNLKHIILAFKSVYPKWCCVQSRRPGTLC